MNKTRFATLVCWLVLCLIGCSQDAANRGSGGGAAPRGALRVAMIPKGTSHVFWKSVHAGADKAAAELGVEVIWKGPPREDADEGADAARSIRTENPA